MINPLNSPRPKETLPISNIMEEIVHAPYFKDIGIGLHRKTYRIGESRFCLKVPHPNQFAPIVLYLMQCEFMMYQISHIWSFDVVPFTKVILHNSTEIEQISAVFNKVNKNDHLQYPLLIQNYVQPKTPYQIDLHQAQKTLIFNWITGRQDREKENSVVNKEGKVFEIDNELTFSRIEKPQKPHWLLDIPLINESPLNKTLINGILGLPETISLKLETLPVGHASHSHPRARQIKSYKNGTIEQVQNQVIENLKTLKSVIHNLEINNVQITPKTIEEAIENLGNKYYVS